MKIGYPCINHQLECRSSKTFRLASYTDERLKETVAGNLQCLQETIMWNIRSKLLFFRITSDLVPFASHPVCTFPWRTHFKVKLDIIGSHIRNNGMRISMHPDQFVLINSPKEEIVSNSIAELQYHCDVLDIMGLDASHKVQIHVGGVYNDKQKSLERFIERYEKLSPVIHRRLVIENDDRLFTVADCLFLHQRTGIPILFDNLHHELNNNGESLKEAAHSCFATWSGADGDPMMDFSSQDPAGRTGKHASGLDTGKFRSFLEQVGTRGYDIMFELKDKETCAIGALEVLKNMGS